MKPLEKRHRILRAQMLKAQALKPTLTISKAGAFTLAMLIHFSTIALALLGLYWLVLTFTAGNQNIVIHAFLSLACFIIAWSVAPRFLFKHPEKVLPRESFPATYALADRVAKALDIPPVNGLIFTFDYNAMIFRTGFNQQTFMYIGIPLWFVLDDQERVAMLAHELAHVANGDFSGSLIVGSANQVLERWYTNLRARIIIPTFQILFIEMARGIVWACLYTMRRLLFNEKQRSEYLADSLAANVSGTTSMLGTLAKIGFGFEYQAFLKRNIDTRRSDRILERFRNYMADLSDEKVLTINREREEREMLYSLTHPPISYRIELLNAFPVVAPKVKLSAEQLEVLKQEFAMIEREFAGIWGNTVQNRFMYR